MCGGGRGGGEWGGGTHTFLYPCITVKEGGEGREGGGRSNCSGTSLGIEIYHLELNTF